MDFEWRMLLNRQNQNLKRFFNIDDAMILHKVVHLRYEDEEQRQNVPPSNNLLIKGLTIVL